MRPAPAAMPGPLGGGWGGGSRWACWTSPGLLAGGCRAFDLHRRGPAGVAPRLLPSESPVVPAPLPGTAVVSSTALPRTSRSAQSPPRRRCANTLRSEVARPAVAPPVQRGHSRRRRGAAASSPTGTTVMLRCTERSSSWLTSSTSTSSRAAPVLLLRGHRVAEHDEAERAGGGDDVGVEAERLVDALDVDPLADLLLHPHPRPAGAAAEAALLAAVHLLGAQARARWRGSRAAGCRPCCAGRGSTGRGRSRAGRSG